MAKKHKALKIVLATLGTIFILIPSVFAVTNAIGNNSTISYARTFSRVDYDDQLIPKEDENGNYYFVTDRKFKVLQITDVHVGGGFLSFGKDRKALRAVANMISYEKPDLVMVTGDVSFPVPYISGSFNNKKTVDIFASLMEQLGVYWTVSFGNHDAEAYNYFNRAKVSEFYQNEKYEYCLFKNGPTDIKGYGNQILNIKNSSGIITQTLFAIDSNAYLPDDPLGLKWHYDNVGQDQIDWYAREVEHLSNYNKKIIKNIKSESTDETFKNFERVSSLIFMHIPFQEMKDAWDEYANNNFTSTENVIFNGGEAGEKDPFVYPPVHQDELFETILEKGSTTGVFFGHDHLNNFSLTYKGVTLSYGMSIDYLAYTDIDKYGSQRGCRVIEINPDSSWTTHLENYYQDKYNSNEEKQEVTFDPYYPV